MRRISFLFLLVALSACSPQLLEPVTEIVRVYITTTPRNTISPSLTPTPTPEPTITPSPTPTAVPAVISGNPRGYQLLDPTPSYGAPCGFVDTFDFPLNPPDGDGARGGYGFGGFNSRYNKYHAGEDWGFNQQSNLGKPVYSIGHGQVTYAAPNGWGLDKGTIVIRHVFPWGGYILSFYGHLAPSSVKIKTGECIERGDRIGEIGNPRTPPHLHFETRLHLPVSTGHGYWSVDPRLGGWLPPSQTILETRMKASPGVQWVMGYKEGLTLNLGTHEDSSLLLYGGEMLSVDPLNGDIRWRQTISETIRNGVLDKKDPQVYLLDLYGDLTAYHLSEPSNLAWTTKLNTFSSAELIPLPGGGVFAADRRRAIVVDSNGNVLWEMEIPGIPVSWAYDDDGLVFITSDSEKPLWMVNENGIDAWDSKLTGQLVETSEDVYLYADDGIYRLDTENQSAARLLGLPGSIPKMRKLILLDNSDLVIVHVDGSDRRLIAFNLDGSQKWEHSIQNIPFGEWVLSHQGGVPYLFASHASSTMAEIELYEINMATGALTHLFHGGNRQSYTRGVWISSLGDSLWLINIWGGPLVGFNPQIAAGIIE